MCALLFTCLEVKLLSTFKRLCIEEKGEEIVGGITDIYYGFLAFSILFLNDQVDTIQ